MKHMLALLLLLLTCASAQAQTKPCDNARYFQHTVATGPVLLVPGVPNQRIYFCGFVLAQKGNTLDFKVWSTDQPDCSTTLEAFSPQWSLPTDVQMVNRRETVGNSTDYGAGLCIQTFGTGALTGAIYYAQF
jgi:hypothetical protein